MRIKSTKPTTCYYAEVTVYYSYPGILDDGSEYTAKLYKRIRGWDDTEERAHARLVTNIDRFIETETARLIRLSAKPKKPNSIFRGKANVKVAAQVTFQIGSDYILDSCETLDLRFH